MHKNPFLGEKGNMLGKIFGIICIVSVFFGIACGNTGQLGSAVIDGASSAVTLTLALLGMMCLWSGILNVLKEAGAIKKLTVLMTPILKFFFPDAYKSGVGSEEIAANVAANLLGVGNAATPLALSAMKKLQLQNPTPEIASRDMITLAVLNTSSVSLIPSTVITLLRSSGSENPFDIIIPIWITSFTCAAMALILCRALGSATRVRTIRSKDYKSLKTQARQ